MGGLHACRSMPISSRSSTIISAPDLHRTPVPRPLQVMLQPEPFFLHGDRAPAVTEGTDNESNKGTDNRSKGTDKLR